MSNITFGTGGWRAIIGDGFTKANVQLLAKALAGRMRDEGVDQKGICLGFDRRFLSGEAARWAAEVFAAEGVPVQLIRKAAPTPLIMFTVKEKALPYGMAMTASHNPALYNGVKVFTAGGRDADETVTKELETRLNAAGSEPPAVIPYEKALADGLVKEINPMNEYIDSIVNFIDMKAIRDRGLRVVLDPMFGVSQTSLQTILMTARCDVDVINERRDTLFGGRLPTPNVETLKGLTEFVVQHKRDMGIATDGDADRLGIINDKGQFLHPNDILVILYYYLLKYKGWRGPVVRNIATTHLLDRVAERFGERCYEVPVGFKHISSKMAETDAVIGGESSGGLTVRGHISGKDGIYAASLLVEMVSVTGMSLSEIYADIVSQFGATFMAERDYRFSQEKKAEIHQKIFTDKLLPAFGVPVQNVLYTDGCKVNFEGGGWIIARFSGTEPLLRIFCEMSERRDAEALCETFKDFLQIG